MPRLGDAYDEAADEWGRRRLYAGAALLFVGAVLAGPGLASVVTGVLTAIGLTETTALTLGIALGALAVPFVGIALLRRVPTTRGGRTAAAVGTVLSAVAVAVFVVAVPSGEPLGPGSVPVFAVVTYVVGVLLMLWTPIVSAGVAAAQSGPSRPKTAFVRERRSVPSSGRVPADGGEEDQELAFLLDQDDK